MTGLGTFLRAVRRRLRLVWLAATLSWAAPLVAAVALVIVLIGRVRPWAWPEPAALAVVAAAVVVAAAAAIFLRISDRTAARAADRGLDSRDVLSTAVEIDAAEGVFADRVRIRAEQTAERADIRRAMPVRLYGRRLAAGGALGALTLVAGIAGNPQDDVRREQAAERDRVAEAAEQIEAAASELAETDPEGTDATAALEELNALAEALAEASTVEEAEDLLEAAEAALKAGMTPEALAQKAAVSGLSRSLEAQPLPGSAAGDDAASQLDAAADALDGLSEDAAAELADRLERLAQTQSVGNPAAADALARASSALAAGDSQGAAEALADAAAAQRAGQGASSGQDARRAGVGAIGEARGSLRQPADGQAAGEGNGKGKGDGKGNGDGSGEGEGKGEGNGSGDGSGKGSGKGGQAQGGSPSGPVAGASGGTGAGKGGKGSVQGSDGSDPVGEEARSDEPSLFDPASGDGDTLDLGGSSTGDDLGDTVGRGDGVSSRGSAFVPLSTAVDGFRQRVTSALDDPTLSPSMRELVRAYFGRLTEGR